MSLSIQNVIASAIIAAWLLHKLIISIRPAKTMLKIDAKKMKFGGIIPRKSAYRKEFSAAVDRYYSKGERKGVLPVGLDAETVVKYIYEQDANLGIMHDYFTAMDDQGTTINKNLKLQHREVCRAIYRSLKSDSLIKDSIEALIEEWRDIDYRCYTLLWRLVYDMDKSLPISKAVWTDAILYSLYYVCRYNGVAIDYYVPDDVEEWKDLYFMCSCFVLNTVHRETQVPKQEKVVTKVIHVVDESSKERIEKLTQELADAETQSRRMAQDTAAYYNKIVKQQAKLLQELEAKLPTEAEQVQSVEPERQLLYDLPTYRVLWVGGHPKTTRRVAELFPGWDIIEVDKLPDDYPDADICFVHVGYLGHKQFNHLRSKFHGTVLSCNSTNIDRLHEELKEVYTSYVLGKEAAT